jgi:hypothetical protein
MATVATAGANTAPDAPTAVVATPDNAQVSVTWTDPSSNGGDDITSYTVSAIDATTPGNGGQTVSGSSSPILVTGLTNGDSYSFTVYATNTNGDGSASDPSNSVTPATLPDVPSTPTAVPGNTQATVSWSAPATGGSPITGYTVSSNPAGFGCTYDTSTDSGLSCVVTGLANGDSYSFSVSATNALGASNDSSASSTITPEPFAVADAPTDATAVAGHGQAEVSWTASASDGYSTITGYSVSSDPAGHGCNYDPSVDTGFSCIVTGLTNGTAYRFTVTATNALGVSTASGSSNSVTPGLPSAPTSLSDTTTYTTADVSWDVPADNGGSSISLYTVTATPGGRTCSYHTATDTGLHCVVTGLTVNTAYVFSVTATNPSGTGEAEQISDSTAAAQVPGTLDAPTVVEGFHAVTVSWLPGVDDGGATITSYIVTASPGTGSCTYVVSIPETDSCTVTGLSPETTYNFTLVAHNSVGDSSPSLPSDDAIPYGNPNAPTAVSVLRQFNGEAVITWTLSTDDGGLTMSSYTASANPGGQTCTTTGYWNQCTVRGLTAGQTYSFTVVAANTHGPSAASSPSASIVKNGLPGAPTAVQAVAAKNSAVVSWTAPSSFGYSTLRQYQVTSSPGSKHCTAKAKTSCKVVGLSSGVLYTFTVTTFSHAGLSASSSPSTSVRTGLIPGAARQISLVAASHAVTVSWAPPLSDGGVAISAYLVTSVPGGQTCTSSGSGRSCSITGLSNGTKYHFTIVATNAIGDGPVASSQTIKPH